MTAKLGLWPALLAAQKECPTLRPDATNPHFRSRFVSLDNLLEHVLPVLNKHGLVLAQPPTHVDGQPALRTTITHAESGESISDVMLLLPAKGDPQGQGAALTYARRYALTALLGIAEEDDDGNTASKRALSEGESPSRSQGSGSTGSSSESDLPPALQPDPRNEADTLAKELVGLSLDDKDREATENLVAKKRGELEPPQFVAWLQRAIRNVKEQRRESEFADMVPESARQGSLA